MHYPEKLGVLTVISYFSVVTYLYISLLQRIFDI